MALQSPLRPPTRPGLPPGPGPKSTPGLTSTTRRWLVAIAIFVVIALAALVATPIVLLVSFFGGAGGGTAPTSVPGTNPVLLAAMTKAAAATSTVAPQCTGMRWSILAGVAQVESNLAAGRTINDSGQVSPRIIGPALNGSGAGGNRTAITDTDGGQWDGDSTFDHAVGVWQFIPSSWKIYGRDGNGDGTIDPHNVYDNALGAVVHLCGTQARDLSNRDQLQQAIYSYNHSWTYADQVMGNIDTFDQIGAAAAGGAIPAASGRAAVIIAAATKWTGTPYSWGGGGGRPGPNGTVIGGPSSGSAQGAGTIGFDCSGLTQYAYAAAGITIPRVSSQQALTGQRIPRSAGLEAVAPGDLIFFGTNPSAGTGIYHVGIYLGGGQMINAPHTGTTVRQEAVWMSSYAGAVHIP